jgi:NitT/TauT family transport system substrate-binding protein
LAVAATLAGCSSSQQSGTGHATTVRLGYFANVTHAAALLAVGNGMFAKELGSTKLKTQVFNAGPDEVTALLGGTIDAAFIGPGPAINSYAKTKGSAIRIVSGAAIGGAALVVRPGITDASQLTGKKIATPQLGNTQDVALRWWLNTHGHHVTLRGGDVTVEPTDNATALQLFEQGKLDGGWVPEPWASRFVLQGNGHVLVDEAGQWPGGRFATTELVVSNRFLRAHPDAVRALIRGELDAIHMLSTDLAGARLSINDQLKKLSGKPLPDAVLVRALAHVSITTDPAAPTLRAVADHAYSVGALTHKPDINGLVDLTLLNQVLVAAGQPAINAGSTSG